MLKLKYFGAVMLAALVTAPAWAAEDTPPDSSANMPTMQQGGVMMPGAMMPMMHQGGGMMPGAMMPMMHQGGGMMPGAMMPMMHQGGGMMPGAMMPMMHPMGQGPGHNQGGDHHGMHAMRGMGHMMMYPQMMYGGMGSMMMNPQMMQMRMQHMHSMEQRLEKIEALLQQLVDQGKSG